MARALLQQRSLELLGIRDRQIAVHIDDETRRRKRVRTPLPAAPKTLGEHIFRKRVDEGLTQKQLAARWGIWRATLCSWEANFYEPEGRKRAKVVEWLGFDPRT